MSELKVYTVAEQKFKFTRHNLACKLLNLFMYHDIWTLKIGIVSPKIFYHSLIDSYVLSLYQTCLLYIRIQKY